VLAGTIMSYCHTCGGMDNIDLVFHPNCANIMRQNVDSSCLGLSALAAATTCSTSCGSTR
jgi:hypothetical protein